MRSGLFYIAKVEGEDKVLGVAKWLAPNPVGSKRTLAEGSKTGDSGRGDLNFQAHIAPDRLTRPSMIPALGPNHANTYSEMPWRFELVRQMDCGDNGAA